MTRYWLLGMRDRRQGVELVQMHDSFLEPELEDAARIAAEVHGVALLFVCTSPPDMADALRRIESREGVSSAPWVQSLIRIEAPTYGEA